MQRRRRKRGGISLALSLWLKLLLQRKQKD
jgi:hypothetical protein